MQEHRLIYGLLVLYDVWFVIRLVNDVLVASASADTDETPFENLK